MTSSSELNPDHHVNDPWPLNTRLSSCMRSFLKKQSTKSAHLCFCIVRCFSEFSSNCYSAVTWMTTWTKASLQCWVWVKTIMMPHPLWFHQEHQTKHQDSKTCKIIHHKIMDSMVWLHWRAGRKESYYKRIEDALVWKTWHVQTDKQKVFGVMFLKESSVMMQVRELLESLLIFHLFGLLLGHCLFYEDPEQPEGKSLTHTHS